MVCYKHYATDPIRGPTTTVRWRDQPLNRPEQTLVGIQYGSYPVDASYVVLNASSWIYTGSGLSNGDSIPHLVGVEYDKLFDTHPMPPHLGYRLVSRSPVVSKGRSDYANSSSYEAPSHARVFATGTFLWNWMLDDYGDGGIDPRFQRVSKNVLDRFIALRS